MDLILPYKIGDLTEMKSFEEGYRGAWFRCKINDMRVTDSGHLECYMEYIDYPDEGNEWIRLFQKNPAFSKQQPSEQIMVRPTFPQWHWKDEAPEQLSNNDVIAIVNEAWKVDDMVDIFYEGCYWSGTITKFLKEDMVEVELFQPPMGEGDLYEVTINDLRPTLDWSLVEGWTVPLSQALNVQAEGESWYVARVIQPISSELETSGSGEGTPSDDGGKGDGSVKELKAGLKPSSSSKSAKAS